MPPRLNPGDLCDGHEIKDILATRAFSEIYAALTPQGEPCAFKLMAVEGDVDKLQAQFSREAEALALIAHANVVRIHGAGVWGDRLWMALERVEGETLGQQLRAGARLPLEDALHLVLQLCAGLAEAHRCGVIHRDLTPDNVMVTRCKTAKIIGFGMAKLEHGGFRTSLEQQVGCAQFAAPERLSKGVPVSARTDIYSLSQLAYLLVAGVPVMGDKPRTLADTVRWQLQEEARPLGELVPGVPSALAALVHEGMEKDPAKRPASMAQVITRLRAVMLMLQAPQRRAARNMFERESALCVTRPMPACEVPEALPSLSELPSLPELSALPELPSLLEPSGPIPSRTPALGGTLPMMAVSAPGARRDRAAVLPAARPTLASARLAEAAPPPARPPAASYPGPAEVDAMRSTDAPVVRAARASRVTPRRVPVVVLVVGVVTAASAATGWMFFGRAGGPATESAEAPRAAGSALAPVVRAAAPTATAFAMASASAAPAAPLKRADAPRRPAAQPRATTRTPAAAVEAPAAQPRAKNRLFGTEQ